MELLLKMDLQNFLEVADYLRLMCIFNKDTMKPDIQNENNFSEH